ncbi:6-bladed beta-propeller [Fodinibius halophilus]|uniref:6-bladed beta-propeller n=1 Tax=Fodinibius halophilus TaxID=1736908 RepID=A0A6M1T210_9BACT|nr:6-bladed beta-propeller [Fodinibius halophilus]NGP90098.1 6-bladed beta-propeller [Fodinibius halophilus]
MKNHIFESFLMLTFLLNGLACTNQNNSNVPAAYTTKLQSELSHIKVTTDTLFVDDSVLEPRRIRKLPQSNRFVLFDEATNMISLIDRQGNILSEAGGEGRGPGEFQQVVQLHIGSDGRIYCLDMLQFRITIFEVRDRQLEYIKSISYKNPQTHSLQSIYVTDFGRFGLYNKSKGFQSSENSFVLYRLDENFSPTQKLLQLPGNQREKVINGDMSLFVPNIFLNRTFWDVDGEWFCYMQTKGATVRKYHLRTGKQKKVSLHQLPERPKTASYLKDIKERFKFLANDEIWSVTTEIEQIPLFSGFWVENGIILLRMFYPAQKDGMIIYFDQTTTDVRYLSIPHHLTQLQGGKKVIYGIDIGDKKSSQLLRLSVDTNITGSDN